MIFFVYFRQVLVTAGMLPYPQLMPRCTGVLCQAGSGTLHSALRAGTPVIVIPALPDETDQPFFAAVAQARGFAMSPGYKGLAQVPSSFLFVCFVLGLCWFVMVL